MKTMDKGGPAVRHNGHRPGKVVAGARRVVTEAKGRFSGLTREARAIESEMLDEAKKRGGELLETAQDKGQQTWKRTEKWIKKNPASAVGTALMIGVILKGLFGSSKE
jgi:ElaB/YqjD/DUF883 family membrane-anchored ribosome-binding protein